MAKITANGNGSRSRSKILITLAIANDCLTGSVFYVILIISEGGINPNGVKYYNNLIDGLLAVGITPIVTIYHWDLPSEIQNTVAPGGWVNDTISELFADYADFCYETFGDRVKFWITLNEPSIFGDNGYEYGTMAPGTIGKRWEARHNTVLAHLKASLTVSDRKGYREVLQKL